MTNKNSKKTAASPNSQNNKGEKNNKRNQLKEELREVAGVGSRNDYIRFIIGIVLLVVSFFMLLSMLSYIFTGSQDQADVLAGNITKAANHGGSMGAYCAFYMMNNLFGLTSLLIPVYILAIVLKLMLKDACPIRLWLLFLHFGAIIILGSIDAAYIQEYFMPKRWLSELSFNLGGQHGKAILATMSQYVGTVVSGIIIVIINILYIGYWFTQVFIWIFKGIQKISGLLFGQANNEDKFEEEENDDTENEEEITDRSEAPIEDDETEEEDHSFSSTVIDLDISDNEPTSSEIAPSTTQNAFTQEEKPTSFDVKEEVNLEVLQTEEEEKSEGKTAEDVANLPPYDPKLDLSRYKYPPLSLLAKHDSGNTTIDMDEQNANKERIINVLKNFDVKISAISATIGPTVTLYEITPAPGVRIAKIRNLEDDIALSLSALGIRIIAPIPGKGTIGIEVPNRRPQVVSMESIINTQKFKETKFDLPIALGRTITNEMFMVDLAKMPHLLVAGATGQGKSVGLNALITSLLYKKHPAELKLVMIDPKKVEFSMYNPLIKHFLAQVPDSEEPVITDVKKVIQTLKSLCQEMDDRYDLLKKARCKNIKEYNAKFIARRLNPENGHHFLPYIVVIIDEFGDLIMTAGKDIELPIARIAQLARAVGIHMVIATQSPRTTIITGKIKANFPGRIAFKVSGRVESMTILDRTGANNLIGRGDMLFLAGSDITRVQCAFVDTPEVEAITEYISQQQGYPYPYELPLVAEEGGESGDISPQGNGSTFEQVARFVVNTQQGSTSKIQRTFSIGFNRAGRLMDQLEEVGIVGPVNGSKPREVYVQSEAELQVILEQLKNQGKHFE